jgi:hypothetical protein
MSKTATKPTFGPDLLDVRVRERFLSSGALDPKVLEKHHADLPDVAAKGEELGLEQPALFGVDDSDDDEEDSES